MKKNPLDKVPPIGQARVVQQYLPGAERVEEVQRDPDEQLKVVKGSTPRNLLKGLSAIAIPFLICGVGYVFFFGDDMLAKTEQPKYEVDDKKQTEQANIALARTIEDADNKYQPPPVPAAVVLPAAIQATQVENKPEERNRDKDEILGSQLEITGSIRLVQSDHTQPSGGVASSAATQSAEAQIAEVEARKAAAVARQEESSKNLIAAAAAGENARPVSDNEAFINQFSTQNPATVTRQQAASSRVMLMEGSVIRSVLLTGVNSDMPGSVSARVTSDVYDSISGRHLLIPKGSVMTGSYNSQVVVGQDKVLVAMTRLILPDGTWVSLLGKPAGDMIGQSGLEADVNNHFWKMFGSSLIVGAVSMFLPDSDTQITVNNTYGGDTSGGSVVGMALKETLTTLLQRNKNISPTLTVDPGQQFLFQVSADMVMKPYVRR